MRQKHFFPKLQRREKGKVNLKGQKRSGAARRSNLNLNNHKTGYEKKREVPSLSDGLGKSGSFLLARKSQDGPIKNLSCRGGNGTNQ